MNESVNSYINKRGKLYNIILKMISSYKITDPPVKYESYTINYPYHDKAYKIKIGYFHYTSSN